MPVVEILFLTCATECGGLSRDPQFHEKSNDVFVHLRIVITVTDWT